MTDHFLLAFRDSRRKLEIMNPFKLNRRIIGYIERFTSHNLFLAFRFIHLSKASFLPFGRLNQALLEHLLGEVLHLQLDFNLLLKMVCFEIWPQLHQKELIVVIQG